jgi:hypothetical protein
MAMNPQLWSLSGLSIELGIDRRTLAKRLSSLRPDGEGIEAGKTVRRWRLARVLRHLKAAGAGADERRIAGMVEDHKHLVSEYLFPAAMGSRYLLGFFLAHLHEDIGLTKPQALRAYGAAVLALHYAIAEFFAGVDAELAGDPLSENIEDHDIEVCIPPELRKLGELGPEAYALKYWSDGPPAGQKRTQRGALGSQ